MSFDFSTLVTDRTKADVDNKTEKGAYNASDLNRVTKAAEYLNEVFTRYGYITGYEPIRIERPGNSRLPDGYTELEYIESTGVQSINTGVLPTSDYEFIFDFSFTPTMKQKLMGHTPNAGWYFGATASNTYDCGKSGAVIDLDATVRRTIKVKSVGMTQAIEIDGMTTTVQRTLKVSETLSIFKITSSTLSASGKLYNAPCQIKQGGKIIRDFVPCKSPDGSIGLYEFVSSSFYGNASSGAFIAGPVVDGGNSGSNSNLDPYTWYDRDIPTELSMERYLQNVSGMRDAITVLKSTPEVPESMCQLTYDKANDIEQILLDVEKQIDVMKSTFVACGPATCGGDYL